MAKSRKEALLEKFSDLQELGIAPTAAPIEDEGPSVVVDAGSETRREGGGRRQRPSRAIDYEDEPRRGGDVPIRPRSRPRRPERGERSQPGGDRPRRGGERAMGSEQAAIFDAPLPPDRPVGPRPSGPERARFGDRPPTQNRPPFGNRPGGGPRFGGPNDGGPPQAGVTDRLRQRAEERRRDEDQREQLQKLLVTVTGGEADAAAFDKFLADLTVEVGALPPLERVVEAVRLANSAEPAKVGDRIRELYRRPRPRPAVLPS
jgi:hypothetical protein